MALIFPSMELIASPDEIGRSRLGLGDGVGDAGGRKPTPEHTPALRTRHAVGDAEVPAQNRIVVASAPKETREIARERLPKVVADAFALRLGQDRELAQVRRRLGRVENGG